MSVIQNRKSVVSGRSFRWQLMVAMFAVFSSPAFHQQADDLYALEGTVRTTSGGIVPATIVTATDEKGRKYSTESVKNGSFRIELKKGKYEVHFEREGYKKLIITNLQMPLVTGPLIEDGKLLVRLDPGRCDDCNGALYGERWDDFTNLAGTVFDRTGAVIPNVTIKAKGDDGIERVAKSNDEGAFEIRVGIGPNILRFESSGFEPFVLEKYWTTRSHKEKMSLDVVLLGSTSHEPCGYWGGDCIAVPKNNRNKINPRK